MPSIRTIGLASLTAVSTLASAHPHDGGNTKGWSDGNGAGCMTWDQAQAVVDNWKELITAYSDAAADRSVTTGFTDNSESVNTLINSCPQGDAAKPLPLLAPTFTNREEFKEGQGQQPPINFEQLQMWHTCSSVTARWKTTNTAPPAEVPEMKPVIGIFVLETVPAADGTFVIDRAYSEFDAGAWLQNLQDWGICGANGDAVPNPDVSGDVSSAVGAPVAAAATPVPASPTVAAAGVSPPPAAGTVAVPAEDTTTYGNGTAWSG